MRPGRVCAPERDWHQGRLPCALLGTAPDLSEPERPEQLVITNKCPQDASELLGVVRVGAHAS